MRLLVDKPHTYEELALAVDTQVDAVSRIVRRLVDEDLVRLAGHRPRTSHRGSGAQIWKWDPK